MRETKHPWFYPWLRSCGISPRGGALPGRFGSDLSLRRWCTHRCRRSPSKPTAANSSLESGEMNSVQLVLLLDPTTLRLHGAALPTSAWRSTHAASSTAVSRLPSPVSLPVDADDASSVKVVPHQWDSCEGGKAQTSRVRRRVFGSLAMEFASTRRFHALWFGMGRRSLPWLQPQRRSLSPGSRTAYAPAPAQYPKRRMVWNDQSAGPLHS
jgi:hypothetical protein